ncbi:MAG: ATP-binding protein [Solirubrobacteraceae bacterium]
MGTLTAYVQRPLGLDKGPMLGHVECVDADRVVVSMTDLAMVQRVAVSDLVALPAGTGFMIAIVEALGQADDAARHDPPLPNGEGFSANVKMRIMPVGTLHAGENDGAGSFRIGAAAYPHIGADCHLIEGERFTAFMSLLGEGVKEDERLVLGSFVADRDAVAIADGNRLLQRHMAILGNTGAGKSWTVALLLERAARLEHVNMIVLDVHGEYGPLARATDGCEAVVRALRIAGPADLLFAGEDVVHLPFWLLELDELLSLVVNENDRSYADQKLCLTDRVQTLKRSALSEMGHSEAVATATADSPVPYQLEDLLRWLRNDDLEIIVRQPSGRVDPGPFAGKLSGLIARLEARMADPRFGFIFHPPDDSERGDWLVETSSKLLQAGRGEVGIKAIDFSEVPAAILPLVAGVLSRLVYNVQFWMEPSQRTPVCIVCDEAHLYLPERETPTAVQRVALQVFEAIAKEGRKYGVCIAVVTQRPSDVSRTILSQCNNFMIMRLTNDQDQEVIRHLVSATLSNLTAVLPMLDVGEAVLIGDAILLPLRIKLDTPRLKPASVTMPYWKMWSLKPSSLDAIEAGVEAMRNQWRGEA